MRTSELKVRLEQNYTECNKDAIRDTENKTISEINLI